MIVKRRLARIKKFFLRTCKKVTNAWDNYVTDPRDLRGLRWDLKTLLNGMLIGLFNGSHTLREVERVTDELDASGGTFDIPNRIPDTTLYTILQRLNWEEFRRVLHDHVHSLFRSKTLRNDVLPIATTAIDGKTLLYDSVPMSAYAQKAEHKDGRVTYNLRVLRAVYTSSVFKPCIDQMPIPPDTNDMGAFSAFFDDLVEKNARRILYELFTLDGGFSSLAIAEHINSAGYAYLIALKQNQPELLREAERILAPMMESFAPEAQTDWEPHGSYSVKRELWRTFHMIGFPTTSGTWHHLRQVWIVRTTRKNRDGATTKTVRFFMTNLLKNRLKAYECLAVVRAHWGIENDVFCSLDMQWDEDSRAWCLKGEAVLCQSFLRLIAYNACQIIRRRRGRPRIDGSIVWPAWKTVFHWAEQALTFPFPQWILKVEGL
jgi:hypothetical protein